MKDNIRLRIWDWILKTVKYPEGTRLSFFLKCVYCLLFPLQFMCWQINKGAGYQIQTDTWIIHGKKYSGSMFRYLAIGNDQTFKIINRDDGIITIRSINEK